MFLAIVKNVQSLQSQIKWDVLYTRLRDIER